LGPTISLSSESLNDKKDISKLLDIISKQKYKKKIFDTLQSEEGGRFFREENRNILVEVEDIAQLDDENNYRWISLSQILFLLNYSNIINIQLRSLISLINE
jgi:oxidase EvaA